MNESDDRFQQRAKSLLDKSIENLDEESIKRLHIARQLSLQKARAKKSFWRMGRGKMFGLGLVATCFVVIVTVNTVFHTAELDQNYIEDLELVASSEELDFYQELEFYSWLTEHSDAG